MTTSRPGMPASARPRKEAFFVQVLGEDSNPIFFNATESLGQQMPFTRWVSTCAMRAKPATVSFSYLHPSKAGRQQLADKPLVFPHGPLNRLEREAAKHAESLSEDRVIVELTLPEKQEGEERPALVDRLFTLALTRDESGLASLDTVEGDDFVFELPRGAVRMSIYLQSPRVPRTLAVACVSYLGKPGAPESVVHAASKNLYALCALHEWRVLSGIESVAVGAGPARNHAVRASVAGSASCTVPLRLFEGNPPVPVGQGSVAVEIDLTNMSHTPGRLLLKLVPSAEIEEVFPRYRATAENAVNARLAAELGGEAEVTALGYDIVLGELSAGQVERVVDAANAIKGLDLMPEPTMWRAHE